MLIQLPVFKCPLLCPWDVTQGDPPGVKTVNNLSSFVVYQSATQTDKGSKCVHVQTHEITPRERPDESHNIDFTWGKKNGSADSSFHVAPR